ncbi:MAG: hypothetical protein EA361_00825 [Bacteroidetes bacterium]|nr:MAG: hypothetical protein EA361_00825 [Bacteroidota bacterium]
MYSVVISLEKAKYTFRSKKAYLAHITIKTCMSTKQSEKNKPIQYFAIELKKTFQRIKQTV